MIATPTLTGPELEQTIASKATVLAWFDGTPNCLGHAFPSFAPVMRRLALHLAGVAKVVLVDVDLVANDALSYGVYGAPELLLFMDGVEVAHYIGVATLVELLSWISPFIAHSLPKSTAA